MPEFFAAPHRHCHFAARATALIGLSGLLVTLPAGTVAAPASATAVTASALSLVVGTQQEIVIEQGVDRLAIADDTVATLLVTRRDKKSTAARLIVTGKSAGSTTLMVWEKGSTAARTYTLNVLQRRSIVTGSTDSLSAHAREVEAAQAGQAKDATVSDRSTVDVQSQTVQVEVKIVEFSRSVLKEAGFNLSKFGPNNQGFSFQSTAASTLTDAFNLALGFGNANKGRGLDLTLKLLESNGLARVLAEPTLVATSGQTASFLAGGELPIPVPQGLGTTSIQYKPFGIRLTVTPTVLSNDRIALKVAPEASDLDYTNALSIDGVPVPAITTRRADTAVELGDGESFIIGGLVSRTTLSNASKVPLLGDIPIIGLLFKQQSYKMNEKELVIMVTPHLVKPIARGTDLSAQLPGSAEQRDGHVWGTMLIGDVTRNALPGFSR